MRLNVNETHIRGRVGGKKGTTLEMQTSKNGNSYVPFSVGVNNNYKTASGDWVKEVDWFQCVAFGDEAESIVRHGIGSGSFVDVTGRMTSSSGEPIKTDKGERSVEYWSLRVRECVPVTYVGKPSDD